MTCVRDCRTELPLTSGSACGIFTEHFLEHLDYYEEAPGFLRECRRVLAPGGVLRIIVPDGGKYLEAYSTGSLADMSRFSPLPTLDPKSDAAPFSIEKQVLPFQTKMEIVNFHFRQNGQHRFSYDFETWTPPANLGSRQSSAQNSECRSFPFSPSTGGTLAGEPRGRGRRTGVNRRASGSRFGQVSYHPTGPLPSSYPPFDAPRCCRRSSYRCVLGHDAGRSHRRRQRSIPVGVARGGQGSARPVVQAGLGISVAGARNVGWRDATSDLCIFIDDDNRVEHDTIAELARAFVRATSDSPAR